MTRMVSGVGIVIAVTMGFAAPALGQAPAAPAAPAAPPRIDPTHYQCYKVEPAGSLRPQQVRLKDQFTSTSVRLGTLAFLCAPVEKNGEPARDPNTHLACYTVPPTRANKRVEVTHQFGPHRMTVVTSSLLCLPSSKRVL